MYVLNYVYVRIYANKFYCNLTQVRDNEYDIQLNSDINSDHHHQWFCFKVRIYVCMS